MRKLSSTCVVLLSLLYLLLAGQAAVCSHEHLIQQESEHGSREADTHELFCGGDCQNISSVAVLSLPPAITYFLLFISWAGFAGVAIRPGLLPRVSSRAPPLVCLSKVVLFNNVLRRSERSWLRDVAGRSFVGWCCVLVHSV
jgi:hypothetical protein